MCLLCVCVLCLCVCVCVCVCVCMYCTFVQQNTHTLNVCLKVSLPDILVTFGYFCCERLLVYICVLQKLQISNIGTLL